MSINKVIKKHMSELPFPKAVLFDFDGVIVDSLVCHHTAWASAYQALFGKQICPFPEATHAGKAPYKIADYFAEHAGDITKGAELNALKQHHLITRRVTPNLLPGVREIQTFLAQKNIPHGIASNAYTSFIDNTVKELNLNFKVYMGVDKFEKPKPSPIPYITLAKQLGMLESDFTEILIFEDSLTGMQAARDSGMIPVGLLTQYTESELRANGAQYIFPTLLEAYQVLVNRGDK